MTHTARWLILDAVFTASFLYLSVQISVFLSLRYLQTAVEAAMALENPEEDTEGYLLEKGVKETFEEIKTNILTLLKFGQVDQAAETTDNTEKAASPTPAS